MRRAVPWIRSVALALLAAGGGAACRRPPPPGDLPEVESVRPLRNEARAALEAARQAAEQLSADPVAASEALRHAVASLERLDRFYLPVLEARDRATSALRLLERGQERRAAEEVAALEEVLLAAQRDGGEVVRRELGYPLELTTRARGELEGGGAPASAVATLEELARHLNLLEIRGELAVDGMER